MFKEQIKSELEQIKADNETKSSVKKAMLTALEKAPQRKKVIRLRATAAIAAMLVIIVTGVCIFNPPKVKFPVTNDGFNQEPTATDSADIEKPKSYDDVFELFGGTDVINDDYEEEWVSSDLNSPMSSSKGESANNNSSTPSDRLTTNFSSTNTQVEGIDESDIIKTDGKYIYTLKGWLNKVIVTLPQNGKLEQNFGFDLINLHINGHAITYKEMYVANDRLIALGETLTENGIPRSVAVIYNIEEPTRPKFINSVSQTGSYISSRLTNGILFILSTQSYNKFTTDKENKKTYLPYISTSNTDSPIPLDDIYLFDCEKAASQTYLVTSSIKIATAEFISHKAALGGGKNVYMSGNSLYVYRTVYYPPLESDVKNQINKTAIIRFEISENGSLRAAAKGYVEGSVLNQFSLAESSDGFLRIVTTVSRWIYPGGDAHYHSLKQEIYNNLYILSDELEIVGSIKNIAPDERIYSARLTGDVGYFVTYRLVDPLFAVDLTDPQNPKILSKLKIPGFSEYLHSYGDGLLLGIGKDSNDREYLKLSMFDVSDPKQVTQKHYKVLKGVTEYAVADNHKSVLIDKDKNIIGFAGGKNGDYYLYSYDSEKGFIKRATLTAPSVDVDENRGLYIDDYLYLCSEKGIISYNLNDFSKVDATYFN